MKPAFALDFRNDAIALLHRTSGGWHQVGRVTFDDPDLPAALSYLRATALGLSPRGLATKLILPDDQFLVTSVAAPGPDEETRLAQIRAALEGRTPYAVDDLVFDWQEVGGEVRVAVIARETLDEAEGFAREHRFNPVAFVAAPASGFAGEAWFGQTAQAAELLAPGETVERDDEAVIVVARAATDAPETDTPEIDTTEPPEADLTPAPVGLGDLDPLPEDLQAEDLQAEETGPEAAEAEDYLPEDAAFGADAFDATTFDPTVGQEDLPAGQADDGDLPATAPALPEAAPEAAEHTLLPDQAEPVYATQAQPDWAPAPLEPRDTPIFGLADDEPPPSTAFRNGAARPDAATTVAPDDLPADLAAALQDIVLEEEAPMALDVEDDTPSATAAPTAQGNRPAARPAGSAPGVVNDVATAAPGLSPAMGFASRRASADAGQAGRVQPPPPRPTVDRPTAAKPLVAPPSPKAERPGLNRPTAARPVAPKESKGLRGLGALVTAPGLPGVGKKKVTPPASPAATGPGPAALSAAPAAPRPTLAPTQNTTPPDAKSLGRSLGGRPMPVRGKPRHLGLILTAVLLVVLALIAAWSTSLAFRSDDSATTRLAAAETAETTPGIEDEMLADGVDPALLDLDLADAALPVADPAPTDAAPTAIAADEEPAAAVTNPGAASGDEIFLAAKDQAPLAPAPLDLPEIAAQGDPLPMAQAPPPPFGTVYAFDANGLIVPTPEGIITPEGVRLVAGKPPRVPQPRSQTLAAPEVAPDVAPDVTGAETAATETILADPALAGFRPKARPAGLTPPAPADATAPAGTTDSTAPAEATPTETGPDDAALPPAAENRLASLRPMARPQTVLAAGDAARAASAAASLAAQAQTPPDADPQDASGSVSKLAVAISRKPAPRPQDLSRAVEAAVAAAVRAPMPEVQPEPAPEPEQVAAVQPAIVVLPKPKPQAPEAAQPAAKQPTKSSGKSIPRGKDSHLEADNEPELDVASVPQSAVSGSVAKQATFKNALNLDKTALIGVYGTPSARYAMIRTSNGRYKKVSIGDSVDGGRIQAITATEVRYQKGSKLVTLAMPKG